MPSFTFNIAKGRIVDLFLRAPNGIAVLLTQAAPDATLKDYDTLAAVLADPSNVEANDASYSRKTGIAGVVTIDDTLDESRVDLPPIIWPALSGSPIVKVLICFQEVASGIVIPLTGHDWVVTPDGSDLELRFP